MPKDESTDLTPASSDMGSNPRRYCLTPLLTQWLGDEALRAPLDTTSRLSREIAASMELPSGGKSLSGPTPKTHRSD